VVVDLGEAQILVRQVPQLADRRLDVQAAFRYGGKQLAQSVLFDGVASSSS